jgi:hypothetical protein
MGDLYNTQLKKVLNRIPFDKIENYLKQYDDQQFGKTKLETKLTYPYYYTIKKDIYKDLLVICKEHNIFLHWRFSSYNDKVYFLNNIPIIIIVNFNFEIKYKFCYLFDQYMRYILPIYYNSRLFQTDLINYINIDNTIKIPKLTKQKLEIINSNKNSLTPKSKYTTFLNKNNYIISGIEAYNLLLNDNIDEHYKTLIMFNTDQEFMKILVKKYYIEKNTHKSYIFKHYYNVYDQDILIMRIFDMRKTPINTYKKTNFTNPHGTIVFLLFNYFIENDPLFLHLAYNLIYELKKSPKLQNECFKNNMKINNLKYIISNKINQ